MSLPTDSIPAQASRGWHSSELRWETRVSEGFGMDFNTKPMSQPLEKAMKQSSEESIELSMWTGARLSQARTPLRSKSHILRSYTTVRRPTTTTTKPPTFCKPTLALLLIAKRLDDAGLHPARQ